jgi:hypothetical protein
LSRVSTSPWKIDHRFHLDLGSSALRWVTFSPPGAVEYIGYGTNSVSAFTVVKSVKGNALFLRANRVCPPSGCSNNVSILCDANDEGNSGNSYPSRSAPTLQCPLDRSHTFVGASACGGSHGSLSSPSGLMVLSGHGLEGVWSGCLNRQATVFVESGDGNANLVGSVAERSTHWVLTHSLSGRQLSSQTLHPLTENQG